MADIGYWALVGVAAIVAWLLAYALAFYAFGGIVARLKGRRNRNTRWIPATREVGNQTWVVVQLIRHTKYGRSVLAEQLIRTLPNNLSNYAHELQRSERVAELRAAWLNAGEPRTPRI